MSDSGMQIRRVKLLGERLTLRTDLSSDELETIEAFAQEKLQRFQIPNSPDPKRQLLLAALHMAGEILELRQKNHKLNELQSKSSDITRELLTRLEDI